MNFSATLNKSSTAVRTRHPQLAEFIKQHALQRGQFTLSSGRTSSYYLDGKKASLSPEGMFLIVDAIFDEIKDLDIDAVGGMDMGATPIVGGVTERAYHANKKKLKMFVVRKKPKEHGTMKIIEGTLEPPSKVVIVDDVVTSGGSILQAIDEVRKENNQVVLAISVVDRNAGAAELLKEKGIPYQPLVTLSDLGIDDG